MGRYAAFSGKSVSWDDALNAKESVGPSYEDLSWDKEYPIGAIAVPGDYKF